MLFALGSCRKRFNDHQNSVLNYGAVFDDNVTKDQALSDWTGNVAKAVAVCNTKVGNALTTGQVQGLKGNRLYAATLFSPNAKRAYGAVNTTLSLTDLRLFLTAPDANAADPVAMGEWGYILAERSVTYMFRTGGAPQLYSTYNTQQSYSGRTGGGTIYTDTAVASLHYTRTGKMPTALLGTSLTSGLDLTVTSAIGYAQAGTAQTGSAPYFGTIDGGYRFQTSGRNAQGQFFTNDPIFYSGNGLNGNGVPANADRNLRISMAVSGTNETPVPKWMGNVIQIGKDYFMVRYDIGTGLDVESTAALVPGDNASFTYKGINMSYPDRVLM